MIFSQLFGYDPDITFYFCHQLLIVNFSHCILNFGAGILLEEINYPFLKKQLKLLVYR